MQTYWICKANRNSSCILFTWYNRAADMKLLFTVPWYDKIRCDIVTARCLLTVFVGSQPEHIALFMENLQRSAVALFMCGFVWVNGAACLCGQGCVKGRETRLSDGIFVLWFLQSGTFVSVYSHRCVGGEETGAVRSLFATIVCLSKYIALCVGRMRFICPTHKAQMEYLL